MRKPLQEKPVLNTPQMQTDQKFKEDRKTENLQESNLNCAKSLKTQPKTDTVRVVDFLKDVFETTEDTSLKYDISKCLEIIQGKENIEMTDLKDTLKMVLEDNERLEKKNIELLCEISNLTEENSK